MLHGSLSRLIPKFAGATVEVVSDNAKPHAKLKKVPMDETAHLSDEDDSSIVPEDAFVYPQASLSPTSERPRHHSLPDLRGQIHPQLPERGHNSDSVLSSHSDDKTKWTAPSSPSSLQNASKPVRRTSLGSGAPFDPESANVNLPL